MTTSASSAPPPSKGIGLALWRAHGPLVLAWLAVVALFVAFQAKHANVPAYHDGVLWWEKASELAREPWFPFLRSYDPGHPPLIAWLLALLWQLPFDRIILMHALSWSFAALFVASVFDSMRRAFGAPVATVVAGLTLLHPAVVSQALQINMDLFLAAFVWLAFSAAIRGRTKLLLLASLGIVFTKLNGLFLLGPFIIWYGLGILREGRLLDWRAYLRFMPLAAACLAFALYHAIKLALVGHVFDSGEFEGGNQIRFVASFTEYRDRIRNCFGNMLNHNGTWYVVLGAAALWPVALLWTRFGGRWPAGREGSGTVPGSSALGLAVLILLVHVATQSLRGIYTLERYFIVCYPALFLLVAWPWLALFPATPRWAALFLLLPFGGLSVLKWHPAHVDTAQQLLETHVRFYPNDVANNYENTLQFTDQFYLLRRHMDRVDRLYPQGTYVRAGWPYHIPAVDKALNDTTIQHRSAPQNGEPPGVIFEFSAHHWHKDPTKDLFDLHPGYKLYRVYRKGRVWVAMFVPPSIPDAP